MVLSFSIPYKPLTTNHIYGQRKFGGRFLKPEVVKFKKEVEIILKDKSLNYDEKTEYIEIEYYFYLSNFYTKKGLINKKSGDIDNFKKALQDSIFKSLGIDDSAICNDVTKKRFSEKDYTVVIIRTARLDCLKSA